MEPFIGQIQPFGFNFAPRGWAFCDGQILAITQNEALFSLLGTTFGGDGRTTFGLPDLRGRSIVHVGNGPGLDAISWGEKSGQYQITLNSNNMPSHTHSFNLGGAIGSTGAGTNGYLAFNTVSDTIYTTTVPSGASLGGPTIGNAGNSQAFNSRNPFLGIYVCIALVGTFPSRN